MLPVVLNLSRMSVMLVGNNERTLHRLNMMAELDEFNEIDLKIYSDDPMPELAEAAGEKLVRRLPERDDIRQVHVVLVAGLERGKLSEIASIAEEEKKVINVEDVKKYCNFYYTSQLRRGDLIISVSTRGASPVLSQKIRCTLEDQFGPEWEEIVSTVRDKRNEWRSEGFSIPDVAKKTSDFINERKWLTPPADKR